MLSSGKNWKIFFKFEKIWNIIFSFAVSFELFRFTGSSLASEIVNISSMQFFQVLKIFYKEQQCC